MPNLGPMEIILIMVVLLLVFGARRLPELGSGLGKGIREFKRSMRDIQDEVIREDDTTRQIQNPPRAQVTPPAVTEENRTVKEPIRTSNDG